MVAIANSLISPPKDENVIPLLNFGGRAECNLNGKENPQLHIGASLSSQPLTTPWVWRVADSRDYIRARTCNL